MDLVTRSEKKQLIHIAVCSQASNTNKSAFSGWQPINNKGCDQFWGLGYRTSLNRSKGIQTWLKASFTWVVSCRRFCPLLVSISTTGENSILLYCNQCFLRLLHRCKKVCTKLFFRGSILSLNTSNVRLMMTMWNNFAIVPSSTQQLQLLLAWMSGQLHVNVFPFSRS